MDNIYPPINITQILQGTVTSKKTDCKTYAINITQILQGTVTQWSNTIHLRMINITQILQGTVTLLCAKS